MPIVYEKLLALKIPEVEHSFGPKDCILYALGLGLGQDPMNEDELAFVYEKNLKALPTFALVQGYSPYWLRNPDSGVNWTKVVHGEQGLTLHKPVKTQGTVIGRTRIVEVIDKGEGKGALVYSERQVTDKASGELLATLTQTTFCRGDGGFGGPPREAPAPHPLPERAPDLVCDLPTRPEMALIYRLSGDVNPLHAEPDSPRPPAFRARFCTALPPSASRATLCSRACAATIRRGSPRWPGASRRRSIRARPSAPRSGATARWRASAPACSSATWWRSTTAARISSLIKRRRPLAGHGRACPGHPDYVGKTVPASSGSPGLALARPGDDRLG